MSQPSKLSILNFTLVPESLAKFHDALVCLGKFSEAVSIEATHSKFVLTALNSSKSAYASFTFSGNFFSKYAYNPIRTAGKAPDKFSCKIYNKALLSVFKSRVLDSSSVRGQETAISHCSVSIEDGNATKSRMVIRIVCLHGILKTYRLTFESVAPMHAAFAKESATNYWSISSRTLKEFVEHFGPGTEQLDICRVEGKVSLTSFTEKIMSGNEVLKQPLHTTITLSTTSFTTLQLTPLLHIIISVKDFRSIVSHASLTNTQVRALYSHPSAPFQISYSPSSPNDDSIKVEFILMTVGEGPREASQTPAIAGARTESAGAQSRHGSERPSVDPGRAREGTKEGSMAPPSRSTPAHIASASTARRNARPPAEAESEQATQGNQESGLFFPEADDDRKWDPVNYDDEDNEMLLWDANTNDAPPASTILLGIENRERARESERQASQQAQRNPQPHITIPTQRLAPTQRLSEIRGMFDD